LLLAWELAALLRRKRFEHGALDLDFPEVKVLVDEHGHPIRLERIENDESHQLIEEFMLAANEAVARELMKRAVPTVYRVHENPDPEKLAEYREFVLSFNYKVGDLTHRAELQRLLAAFRGKPEEQAQGRSAQKFETRALLSAAARPLRAGQGKLFAFHQSDPALCRSGSAPFSW
jgi:ribonuclease R